MMRYDALNLHIHPLRIEMTGEKQIMISHIFSTDDEKSKEFPV